MVFECERKLSQKRILISLYIIHHLVYGGCGYFPTNPEGDGNLEIISLSVNSSILNPSIPVTVSALLDTIPGRNVDIFWNATGGRFYSQSDKDPETVNPTQWYADEPGSYKIICTVSDSIVTRSRSIIVTVTIPEIELPGLKNTSIVFCSKMDGGDWELYKTDPDGTNMVRLTDNNSNELHPKWSPDGSKIVFSSDKFGNYDIFIMNSDGSGQRRLTSDPEYDSMPTWSPDGLKIAFTTSRHKTLDNKNINQIYIINSDGSGEENICNVEASSVWPHWSAFNNRITFLRRVNRNREIYSMNCDGSSMTRLTFNNTGVYELRNEEECPVWSPDGTRIAFSVTSNSQWEVFTMSSSGGNLVNLTNNNVRDHSPAWSPDGSKIVYFSNLAGLTSELYIMDPDGSNKQRITYNNEDDFYPDWSPIIK